MKNVKSLDLADTAGEKVAHQTLGWWIGRIVLCIAFLLLFSSYLQVFINKAV